MTKSTGELSEGQRAYEARRAAKAGMSLEKWLQAKKKEQEEQARAEQKAAQSAKPTRKPGLISRLIERGHRPLG